MKIVKIGAMWCPACIIMNKFWKEIKEEFNSFEFIDYDIDMDEDKIDKYNPGDTLPVIIMINNDKEIKRLVGERKKEEVVSFLTGED